MRSKESTPEVKKLYDELMDVIRSYPVATVFATGIEDLTSVVFTHDLRIGDMVRFYLFSSSATPLAELTADGGYLILYPYGNKNNSGDRYLSDEDIFQEMKTLVALAYDRRDQACSLDTRMTYNEAFGPLLGNALVRKPAGNRGLKLTPRKSE